MNRFLSISASWLALLVVVAPANLRAKESAPFAWENAIISMQVTSKAYNYVQPWERSERTLFKSGVVIDGHLIITTAEGLDDATVIQLKKQGSGLFSFGKIAWVDYQANLAAVTTDDSLNAGTPNFWEGLQPAKLADPAPITGQARILRWRDDQLEDRQGDIERMTVENSALSFVSVPLLKVDSNITNVGYGEAITVNDKLVGLACEQGGDAISAIPTSFIASILKAQASNTYTGLGYFDFTWDPVQNPLNLEYLKLPGAPRGVIVKETGLKPGVPSLVKTRDIIEQIDGFDIDAEGNYQDPQYKKLCLENLSSRNKWAGAECKMKIWRDGKEMDLVYKLPRAAYADELVPQQSYDESPQYVLAGGFIFVPLTEAYLRSWGPSWRQRAPFRLAYYDMDKVTAERPQRVVLAQVLPSEVNLGYDSYRNVVVDQVNGIKIKQISDIVAALKTPVNGFDVFTFASGESIHQAVLDASQIDKATTEIMTRYGIRVDHVLSTVATDPPAGPAKVASTPATSQD